MLNWSEISTVLLDMDGTFQRIECMIPYVDMSKEQKTP